MKDLEAICNQGGRGKESLPSLVSFTIGRLPPLGIISALTKFKHISSVGVSRKSISISFPLKEWQQSISGESFSVLPSKQAQSVLLFSND